MDEARALELAREMGLDKPPPLRYDDAPKAHKDAPTWLKPKFLKALQLVDQIETWAFEKFIPDVCTIDQSIDAHVQGNPELHFAVCVRTDRPPPSNDLVWRATGIKPVGHPEAMGAANFYQWLAIEVANMYREVGAKSMGVPLIFRTKGSRFNPLVIPFVGAICKFDRRPPDGQRMADQMANVGVLVPSGTHVAESHRVMPINPTPKAD
jgi:hypothetical protein